jgi:hypothetical protein
MTRTPPQREQLSLAQVSTSGWWDEPGTVFHGAGGSGFICCSCHNVQAGTPVENVLAMVDEVTRGAGRA